MLLLGALQARVDDSERLALVPDGPLWLLPFAALQAPSGGGLLIEGMPVSLVASATVLAQLRSGREAGEEGLGLGVAEAAVVLEDAGTALGDHEADVEEAAVGAFLAGHAVDGGDEDLVDNLNRRISVHENRQGVHELIAVTGHQLLFQPLLGCDITL